MLGDCLEQLKKLTDDCVDSIVTDPPYELGFMGKSWDASGIAYNVELWQECLRVLKPGGHLLAFSGSRTYHRMTVAIEDAGFEIRDQIMWVYGCLSEDSEVLTRGGWCQYHTIINTDTEIMIYDTERDIYKWEKPQGWFDYKINNDTAYRIKSDSTDQIVSRNHRCLVERDGNLVFIQAENLNGVERVPTLSDDFFVVPEATTEILQQGVQRSISWRGMEETCSQGTFLLDTGEQGQFSGSDDRGHQSIVEGWDNLSVKEGVLSTSEVEVYSVPNGIHNNVSEGRIRSGISVEGGNGNETTIDTTGMCSSYRPQSDEQRHIQPDVICDEQGSQEIRSGASYSTTLANITTINYEGNVFCPTVSTGAFVARRNGQVFVTGNSGFPKSLNVSKAIDKAAGAEREVLHEVKTNSGGMAHISKTNAEQGYRPSVYSGHSLDDAKNIIQITAPATDEAKQWDGWGTALKPAHEPICVARKPLIGTVAQNVLTHGTGGLNIDGCRVVTNDKTQRVNSGVEWGNRKDEYYEDREPQVFGSPLGRFPANFIHDGSDEVIGLFPETASGTGNGNAKTGEAGNITPMRRGKLIPRTDHGSAARFFYCAKASKKDRNEGLDDFPDVLGGSLEGGNDTRDGKDQPQLRLTKNNHPTVKPTSLMRYLCKLITPPNGTVLDPFMGSGSTGKAAVLEGFNFIGIERDESYFEIATARIEHATKHGEKSDKKSNQSSTGSSNNTHFDDIFE
jgi:site-specific DNA-methyltransferase (adenine-specific)